MDDLLCDPSTKVYVYEDQGRKTGMIILKFSDADAEIIGIAVSVDARRKGIGKQLIRRVMELDDLECVKAQTDDWRNSFDEQYLQSIKFVCLAMSDEYINSHFEEIKSHGSDIETRLDDSYCTA